MQLGSEAQIPDGILAANALLSEKPRLGVPSAKPTLHPGINRCNSTAALGVSWSVVAGTHQTHVMGRFMSPDYGGPMATPDAVPWADFENPQSLNLYSYGGNNPLTNTDDDGHDYYLLGGSQCGQTSIQCDQQGFVLGADGNRSVVTDQALANGTYGASAGANGGVNITTGQGTFAGQFFDPSPGAVSATVYADPRVSSAGMDFVRQTNAYNQAAMPLINTAAMVAGGELGALLGPAGGLTTLGDVSITPTAGETAYAQRLLAQGGRRAVEKSIRTLTKRLAEHQGKLGELQGNPGSVEREIAGFGRTIEALKQVLR